jgi:hypothetical protein
LKILPEIDVLNIAPPMMSWAGPNEDDLGAPGENRLHVAMQGKVKFTTDPDIGQMHDLHVSLSVAATPERLASSLLDLEPLAHAAAAELLEAIAADLRKKAARR